MSHTLFTVSLLKDTELESSYFVCQCYKQRSLINDHSIIIIIKHLPSDILLFSFLFFFLSYYFFKTISEKWSCWIKKDQNFLSLVSSAK